MSLESFDAVCIQTADTLYRIGRIPVRGLLDARRTWRLADHCSRSGQRFGDRPWRREASDDRWLHRVAVHRQVRRNGSREVRPVPHGDEFVGLGPSPSFVASVRPSTPEAQRDLQPRIPRRIPAGHVVADGRQLPAAELPQRWRRRPRVDQLDDTT